MSEINKADFTPDAPNFKKLVLLSFQGLTNFPYIEEDFDALTNYGLLSKVIEYLNEVISNNNEQNDLMTGLYNAYVELQTYVNDYFDNLDVQDEINNKLEDMATNGELYAIIRTYTDPIVNEQNALIAEINRKVNGVASGSPLVASSTSEMTDTTRVYVNTTDGKWYYYNGTAWTIGGTYQSTGIGNNEILYSMMEESLQKNCQYDYGVTGSYTSTGTKWSGFVNETISLVEDANYKCGSLEVSVNDVLVIPYFARGGYNVPVLYFCHDNTIISTITQTDLVTNNMLDLPKYYKIPSTVNNVKFNTQSTYFSQSPNLAWYPYVIKGYSYLDNRLTNLLSEKEEITYSSSSHTLNTITQEDYEFANFTSLFYDVNPLDKIHVNTIVPSANQFVAGIYYDTDNKRCGILLPQSDGTGDITVSKDTIVPANAVKLCICVNNSNVSNVVVEKYKLTDVSVASNKKLTANYQNGILTITNNSNGNFIKFNNFGGNNLFMIQQYKVGTTNKTINTDMIPAPYTVDAINNADGDRTGNNLLYGFVGGNHQWNNLGSGSTPTARQVGLSVYGDNTLISNNTTVQVDEVTIIETNRVQANNTCLENGNGREVLEEKIVFKFDGKNLNVSNTIKPLEDIKIKRYYGIQTAGFGNNEYLIYGDKIYTDTSQTSVTKKPNSILGGNSVNAIMLNTGLGEYQYNQSNVKVDISNSKSYFVPIYNNNEIFTTSDINYIEGRYVFDSYQK